MINVVNLTMGLVPLIMAQGMDGMDSEDKVTGRLFRAQELDGSHQNAEV